MSQCSMRIELSSQTVYPLQTFTGTVHVRVEKECECNSLAIVPVVEVSGSQGTSRSDNLVPARKLFRGKWYPGEYEYAFEMTAPTGPAEYLGSYVSFSWLLEATADIGGGLDAKVSKSFKLLAPEGMGVDVTLTNQGDPQKVLPDEASMKMSGNALAYIIAVVAFLGGVAAIVVGAMQGEFQPLVGGVFVVGFVVVAMVVRKQMRQDDLNAIRRKKILGRPQLVAKQKPRDNTAMAERAVGSKSLECLVYLPPGTPEAQVEVSLLIYEKSLTPHGEHSTLESLQPVHNKTVKLSLVEPGCYRGWLPVPDARQVPVTFGSHYSSIKWELNANIKLLDPQMTHSITRKLYAKLDCQS